MYKIYINEKPLIITQTELKNEDLDEFSTRSYESDTFVLNKQLIVQLNEGKVIHTSNENELFEKFKQQFKVIYAAGGLVKNENGEYLFIFRRRKWDLPKGKLDPGETDEIAAVREVKEECGLNEVFLGDLLTITWHIYFEKKEWVLKKTVWFEMTTKEITLIPQIEEDITEIKWIGKNNFNEVKKNTYQSILEIIKFAK